MESTYNESCKRYYQAHKTELNEKMKPYKALYRERHREEIRAKAKEAYQLKKLKSSQRVGSPGPNLSGSS